METKIYYRPATYPLGGIDQQHKFIYVHQEPWQCRLLSMYGNYMILIDATYKKIKYSLPLFLLVVRTNIKSIPVAQFITEDEQTGSIAEAVHILKEWNTSWSPSKFHDRL